MTDIKAQYQHTHIYHQTYSPPHSPPHNPPPHTHSDTHTHIHIHTHTHTYPPPHTHTQPHTHIPPTHTQTPPTPPPHTQTPPPPHTHTHLPWKPFIFADNTSLKKFWSHCQNTSWVSVLFFLSFSSWTAAPWSCSCPLLRGASLTSMEKSTSRCSPWSEIRQYSCRAERAGVTPSWPTMSSSADSCCRSCHRMWARFGSTSPSATQRVRVFFQAFFVFFVFW